MTSEPGARWRPMFAYSKVEALAVIIVGSIIVYGAGKELLSYFRARHRLQRARGVVVARVDVGRGQPNTVSRSPVIRFTTSDGRVVETLSALSTFPGARVGKEFTVVYDPDDPEGTADRLSAWRIKFVLGVPLLAGGAAFTAWGIAIL